MFAHPALRTWHSSGKADTTDWITLYRRCSLFHIRKSWYPWQFVWNITKIYRKRSILDDPQIILEVTTATW